MKPETAPGRSSTRRRPDSPAESSHWARTRLAPDPYAGGESGDEYLTTTLYFDTDDFKVYQRRGSYRRSKYRIRRYGSSDVAFLERKLRTSMLLSKRRTSIPLADLARIDDTRRGPGVAGLLVRPAHRHAPTGAGQSGVVSPPCAGRRGSFRPDAADVRQRHHAQPCTHFGFDPPTGVVVLARRPSSR